MTKREGDMQAPSKLKHIMASEDIENGQATFLTNKKASRTNVRKTSKCRRL